MTYARASRLSARASLFLLSIWITPEPTKNLFTMEYRPRYPQPFTLEQIVQLDVITITEGPAACSPAVIDIIA